MAKLRLGALEAGGTKMVCAIGNENGEIYEQISIPTTTPEETIPKMIDYFRDKDLVYGVIAAAELAGTHPARWAPPVYARALLAAREEGLEA